MASERLSSGTMYPEKCIGGVLGGDADGMDSWGDDCLYEMLEVSGDEVDVCVDGTDLGLRRS